MADSENDKWSEETYNLHQLANELPCVVRVDEGIYGNNDSESFSSGDIIWLEEKRTIQKIVAQYVDISDWSVDEEEILIPLGFKCPVKVLIPENALRTTNLISNLVANFPRFARVDKDFTSPCGRRFTRGSQFELERLLPKKESNAESSLVVKYQNREIPLPLSSSGMFTPLEDYTLYSLKEIIDRYPLPQYVKFLGDEIQNLMTTDIDEAIHNVKSFRKYGIFRMSSIESKPVIIGHIKPVMSDVESKSSFCQRNGIILPLDKGPVLDIEFQTHAYSESSDYEMILARNFSNCAKLGKEAFEGLYIDYKKKPRVYVIPSTPKVEVMEEHPSNCPPLPPRKRATKIKPVRKVPKGHILPLPSLVDNKSEKPSSSVNTDKGLSSDDDQYEIPCIPQTYKISSIGDVFSSQADYSDDIFRKETKLHRAKTAGKDVMDAVKGKMHQVQNMVNKNLKLKKKPSVSDADLPLDNETADYDYPDLSKMDFFPNTNTTGKPVGFVLPVHHIENENIPSKDELNCFTVDKLCRELHKCGLNPFAEVCQSEKVDGEFVCTLTDDDLSNTPFNLTRFDILKFHQMRTGWRPKLS